MVVPYHRNVDMLVQSVPSLHLLVPQIPEVPLLPGNGMKNGGDHKQSSQAEAIDPGRERFPVVVGQDVEDGTAQDARNNPELGGREMEGKGESVMRTSDWDQARPAFSSPLDQESPWLS